MPGLVFQPLAFSLGPGSLLPPAASPLTFRIAKFYIPFHGP